MTVGQNIRSIRRRRGLTLDDLSALCGIGRDELGSYELGQTVPRPQTVAKIAQALNIPIVTIHEGIGWTAQEPMERWETDRAPLYDGILETVRESWGEEFTLDEEEIQLLMASVKASIPALVEHMKDTRSEDVVSHELLEALCEPVKGGEEALAGQSALTDAQWEQLRPLLPPENAGKGRAFKSNRLMLDGILFRMKSGAAWRDLPKCYGRYKCVSDRLRLWKKTGVWGPVQQKLLEMGVIDGVQAEED